MAVFPLRETYNSDVCVASCECESPYLISGSSGLSGNIEKRGREKNEIKIDDLRNPPSGCRTQIVKNKSLYRSRRAVHSPPLRTAITDECNRSSGVARTRLTRLRKPACRRVRNVQWDHQTPLSVYWLGNNRIVVLRCTAITL